MFLGVDLFHFQISFFCSILFIYLVYKVFNAVSVAFISCLFMHNEHNNSMFE